MILSDFFVVVEYYIFLTIFVCCSSASASDDSLCEHFFFISTFCRQFPKVILSPFFLYKIHNFLLNSFVVRSKYVCFVSSLSLVIAEQSSGKGKSSPTLGLVVAAYGVESESKKN